MKAIDVGVIGMLVAAACTTAFANEDIPIKLAQKAGFFGCNTLISEVFTQANKASETRFSSDYFNESTKEAIDLHATFGSPGDSVFMSASFTKKGEYCLAVVKTLISEEGNCAGLLSKDQYFKYSADAAGAVWAKNSGGIDKLFIQSGRTCNQIFIQSFKLKGNK